MQSIDSTRFAGAWIPRERPVIAGRARPVAVFCRHRLTDASNDKARLFFTNVAVVASRFAFPNLEKPHATDPQGRSKRHNFVPDMLADGSVAETLKRPRGWQSIAFQF